MIPDDARDEIRRKADIVAVIGQHVKLRKAGVNHVGLCPFHDEKTPSFSVNGEKGVYYCFGCGKKGDVFSFVMEFEGKSFVEAAQALAERFGVALQEVADSPARRRERSDKALLYDLNRLAARFFRDRLTDPQDGQRARAYLEARGIAPEVATRFGLGYAPASWDAFASVLRARGVPERLALAAGLVKRRRTGDGVYDAFRDRIMCPIVLPGGEVCGFSGRALESGDDAGPKYINSPESPVYKKSKLLFGLHRAREAFRATRRALVVEGNFDVIVLHQYGFEEAVAPLGTALTDAQVDTLRRLVDEVVLVYDGDRAGRAATLKALKLLVAAGVTTRIARIPLGEDPDSLVRADPAAFRQIIDRAQYGVEYFVHEVWAATQWASADSRAQAVAEAAEVIGAVPDETRRNLLVGELAAATGVDDRVVRRALTAAHRGNAAQAAEIAKPRRSAHRPVPAAELEIIAILADHPTLLGTAEQLGVFSLLTDPTLRDMYSAQRKGQPILAALPEDGDPRVARQVLSGAYASLKNPESTLRAAVRRLEQCRIDSELRRLQQRAIEAGRRGDVDLQRKLVSEIYTLKHRNESKAVE
ncbi:MAG: DNA primase [Deltaproteobacteria bacterium]|nr:MAG: DNA primase [Deltaproteobacteria bacterium]